MHHGDRLWFEEDDLMFMSHGKKEVHHEETPAKRA